MPLIFLLGFVVIGLWSVVAHRFERTGVAGPAVLALAGAVLVLIDVTGFSDAVGSDAAEHVVELILAVLLFVDACEVSGGVFGGEGRTIARLVLVVLALTLFRIVPVYLSMLGSCARRCAWSVRCDRRCRRRTPRRSRSPRRC